MFKRILTLAVGMVLLGSLSLKSAAQVNLADVLADQIIEAVNVPGLDQAGIQAAINELMSDARRAQFVHDFRVQLQGDQQYAESFPDLVNVDGQGNALINGFAFYMSGCSELIYRLQERVEAAVNDQARVLFIAKSVQWLQAFQASAEQQLNAIEVAYNDVPVHAPADMAALLAGMAAFF